MQIFTTNYDVLVEQALEDLSLPLFDGFVGARTPFFDVRAIEDDTVPTRWTRVWKLHGSVNWRLARVGGSAEAVVRVAADAPGSGKVLIHPSELKYDQSRRMPYLAMIDRLRHFLRQPSAFLVTCGYSFADAHLNEVLMHGLRANPTAAAFGLLYRKLAEEQGAVAIASLLPSNLALLARDEGVFRTHRGPWLTSTGGAPPECDLGDFGKFAGLLSALAASSGSAGHA